MSTLSETNLYLRDKKTAKKLNLSSTRTSSGVEGIVAHSSVKIHVKADTSKLMLPFEKFNLVFVEAKKHSITQRRYPASFYNYHNDLDE